MGAIKVDRLERITKTVEVGQLNWYGRDDIQYLLSIIEKQDKFIEKVSTGGSPLKTITEVSKEWIAEAESLKTIRKGD